MQSLNVISGGKCTGLMRVAASLDCKQVGDDEDL